MFLWISNVDVEIQVAVRNRSLILVLRNVIVKLFWRIDTLQGVDLLVGNPERAAHVCYRFREVNRVRGITRQVLRCGLVCICLAW